MSKAFDFAHQPVLVAEIISVLNIKPDGCYVDCTLGGGGHAAAILGRLTPVVVAASTRTRCSGAGKALGQSGSPAGIHCRKQFADDAILDRLADQRSTVSWQIWASPLALDNPSARFRYAGRPAGQAMTRRIWDSEQLSILAG